MLSRLLTLAVILGIAYYVLTEGAPMLRRHLSGPQTSQSPGDSDADRCVHQAVQANESLTRVARQYGQPPVDVEAWSSAQWDLQSEIQSAESACFCAAEACQSAAAALTEMRNLLSNLDGMVRGDSPGFANPANQQARVYDLLDQARAAAQH